MWLQFVILLFRIPHFTTPHRSVSNPVTGPSNNSLVHNMPGSSNSSNSNRITGARSMLTISPGVYNISSISNPVPGPSNNFLMNNMPGSSNSSSSNRITGARLMLTNSSGVYNRSLSKTVTGLSNNSLVNNSSPVSGIGNFGSVSGNRIQVKIIWNLEKITLTYFH